MKCYFFQVCLGFFFIIIGVHSGAASCLLCVAYTRCGHLLTDSHYNNNYYYSPFLRFPFINPTTLLPTSCRNWSHGKHFIFIDFKGLVTVNHIIQHNCGIWKLERTLVSNLLCLLWKNILNESKEVFNKFSTTNVGCSH